jgi:predicted SAM-dependent methyltransferase
MSVVAKLRRRAGALLSPDVRRFNATRRELAERHLAGDGIEIGALHRPLVVPRAARVRFVDREDVAALRRHYPELQDLELVTIDIVDDGESLATLADASVDFVIANHFIEHTQSPLATLRSHLRVLRPGGVLYLAVPDKRHTFDVAREVTPLEHVLRDLEEGPEWSREQHFYEWARYVDKAADVDAHAAKLMADDYSIHFHVWTSEAFEQLLQHARDELGMPFEIVELRPNQQEFIAVLRRRA